MNSGADDAHIRRFVSLIADSLLGLKPVSSADIPELEKENDTINKQYSADTSCTACISVIKEKIKSMTNELRQGSHDMLYYRSSTKYFPGYWRFEFTIRNGHRYIRAEFIKLICNRIYAPL
ncbi:MAG: hypothetical protein HKL88_02465 [Bacteroidia bacterium]|nr:hypothetical protein [Bacteroidia bacterium]